jgi:broad specificity phosphatase PhoE
MVGEGRPGALVADVLWARHGQNLANLTHTFSHRVFDGDLTDLGRRQAQDLAERLAAPGGDPVGRLVCSPLRRARQTADIVGLRLGLPVVMELDELREVNVGDLDGRSDARAWETYAACSRPGGQVTTGPGSPAARTATSCAPGSAGR